MYNNFIVLSCFLSPTKKNEERGENRKDIIKSNTLWFIMIILNVEKYNFVNNMYSQILLQLKKNIEIQAFKVLNFKVKF